MGFSFCLFWIMNRTLRGFSSVSRTNQAIKRLPAWAVRSCDYLLTIFQNCLDCVIAQAIRKQGTQRAYATVWYYMPMLMRDRTCVPVKHTCFCNSTTWIVYVWVVSFQLKLCVKGWCSLCMCKANTCSVPQLLVVKKKQSNDPTSHLIYDLGKDLPANPMVSFTGFKPFSLQYDMAF